MREVGPQQSFDRLWRVLRLDVAIDLVATVGVGPEAATGVEVIALDGIALIVGGNARREQADVADIVLRAGMVTAGQVNVERAIDRRTVFAILDDVVGMALGIGSRELAAGIAGAGDDAGPQ